MSTAKGETNQIEPALVRVQHTYQVIIPRHPDEVRNLVVLALYKDWIWIEEIEKLLPMQAGAVATWDYADKEEAYIRYVKERWTDEHWAAFLVEVSHGGNLRNRVNLVDVTLVPTENHEDKES